VHVCSLFSAVDMIKSGPCGRVYDARTLGPQPVARVRLPRRVPFDFHATFVTEAQLAGQRPPHK
jgi:carotenoid cleavage dioxygenase-like enzyme